MLIYIYIVMPQNISWPEKYTRYDISNIKILHDHIISPKRWKMKLWNVAFSMVFWGDRVGWELR